MNNLLNEYSGLGFELNIELNNLGLMNNSLEKEYSKRTSQG